MELDYPEVHIDEVSLIPLKGSFQVIRSSRGLYLTGELQAQLKANAPDVWTKLSCL